MDTLKVITKNIIESLKGIPASKHAEFFSFQDYHGFSKSRLPDSLLEKVLASSGLAKEQVQIEIVGVSSDLSDEVHLHEESDAFVVVLGPNTNFPEPSKASSFLNNVWVPISEDQEIKIPKGTPHGFTVSDGGSLYFLSVQSPPIVDEHGEDDYVKIVQ